MEENEENFHRNHLALKVPRVPAASHFAATCTLPLFLPCRTACSRLSASLTPSRSRKIRGRSKRSVAHEQRSAACAPSTVQLARHASRVTTSCPRAVRLPGCLPHGTCPLCPAEGSAAAADRGDAAPEGHARSDRHEEQQLSSRPCSGPSAAGHHRRRGAARPAGVANAPAPNQRCPVAEVGKVACLEERTAPVAQIPNKITHSLVPGTKSCCDRRSPWHTRGVPACGAAAKTSAKKLNRLCSIAHLGKHTSS